MIDFKTLTNKDEVMDYLESEFSMTDEGYSVVKQDEAAITKIINEVWAADFECYVEHSWDDLQENILQELVAQGYLKEDD